MLPTKFWAEMTWRDFAAADMGSVVAVLPVAATEQHGPHLPVGTDTFISEGYFAHTIELLPADLPVLFLPVQAIGKSDEHVEYPGTLTLSPETLIRAWTEIGDSVARTGCRKLVFINSHGGNVPIIDIVTRELRRRYSMLAIQASWRRLGYPEDAFSMKERAHGIHGGDDETSVMLAFQPQLVRQSEARNFESAAAAIESQFKRLRVTQPIGLAWMASDLHELGAAGDASHATAERGKTLAETGATKFIELLRDVVDFDLARLRPGPLKEKGK